jgi:hypothetical protein
MKEWPAEAIPDADFLYLRVPRRSWIENKLAVFRDHEGAMSTDWEKYSTPEETRQRARRNPADYGVLRMECRLVRSVPQAVEHSPDSLRNNRAHTNVIGEKSPEVRLKLSRISGWAIPVPDQDLDGR